LVLRIVVVQAAIAIAHVDATERTSDRMDFRLHQR
jgi:hypothetical protein